MPRSSPKQSSPGDSILDTEIIMMKFKECRVIINKTMNRNKIFLCLRNIENVFEMDLFVTRGINNSITNMANVHTYAIGGMNLLIPIVFVLHGECLQRSGDVIGRPRVNIPIGIDTVGCVSNNQEQCAPS